MGTGPDVVSMRVPAARQSAPRPTKEPPTPTQTIPPPRVVAQSSAAVWSLLMTTFVSSPCSMILSRTWAPQRRAKDSP
jgi:hypothetical protein